MSTGTAAPPAQSPAPAKRATFGNVLSSEWTKIMTVKSTFWTMIAAVIVTIGLSLLLALAFTSAWDQMKPADRAQFDPASFGLVGINFGMVAFGVLGVLVITGEYATGMIRTALTAMPRRMEYLTAKVLVLGLITLVVGQIVAFASFLLSQLIFKSKDINASLGDDGVLRAVIGGGLYLALIAVIALGIGVLLRHTAGSVTTILGVLFVLPIIGSFLPGDWGRTVSKFLPSNAGGAIMTARPLDDMLSPWAGFGVFLLYTAIVLVAAFAVFQKRDA
ncbi:ABC transporter permease subunit [Spirillospora sp. NPDC047279]|uniref:ABC transporter permease subunit n=1 Tax=Spirillospora sp. NPDC047279 TaxID=3155478 RepID=UPI00341152EE